MIASDPNAAAGPGPVQPEEPTLGSIARSLLAGWVWIVLGIACFGGAGAWYSLVASAPTYVAATTLALGTGAFDPVDPTPGAPRDQAMINTEIEVMRSRSLVASVAVDLGLAPDADSAEARAAQASILSRTRVVNLRNSRVLRVTAQARDPSEAAELANALADAYVASQVEARMQAVARSVDWLRARVAALEAELARDQAALKVFTSSTRLATDRTVAALNGRIDDLRERIVAEAGDALTGTRLREIPASSATGALLSDLAALEAELEGEVDALSAEQRLRGRVARSRDLLDQFELRLREAAVWEGLEVAEVRVLSRAVEPRAAASPNPPVTILVASVLGFLLSSTLVLVRGAVGGVGDMRDLRAVTGLEPLGRLEDARRGTLWPLDESVRDLRVTLLKLMDAGGVVAITSAEAEEGATELAARLARGIAAVGKPVMLVECDLEARPISAALRRPDAPGLRDAVSGRMPPMEAVFEHTELPGVAVMLAGDGHEVPADLLGSPGLGQVLADAVRAQGIVLLALPPLLSGSAARAVLPHADLAVMAVREKAAARTRLMEAARLLAADGPARAVLVEGRS